MDCRPSTSNELSGRGSSRGSNRGAVPMDPQSLQRSQLNLAAALLDAAAKGSRLTDGQKAELQEATDRFGQAAIEMARLERLTQHRGARGGAQLPLDGGGMSRSGSAPQLPSAVGGMSRSGSAAGIAAGMPKPIFDAWQRGDPIPGMPPLLPRLSAEKLREIEERRRRRAKAQVEEWRMRSREEGAKWLVNREWYVKGDRPTKSYRMLMKVGPGYGERTAPPSFRTPPCSPPPSASSICLLHPPRHRMRATACRRHGCIRCALRNRARTRTTPCAAPLVP